MHCPAPSHDRDAALEALSVRVPAGVDEERLYHHWDGPSEFTKTAHWLRGWVGEDENGDFETALSSPAREVEDLSTLMGGMGV